VALGLLKASENAAISTLPTASSGVSGTAAANLPFLFLQLTTLFYFPLWVLVFRFMFVKW
jgi:hypothetical protein